MCYRTRYALRLDMLPVQRDLYHIATERKRGYRPKDWHPDYTVFTAKRLE